MTSKRLFVQQFSCVNPGVDGNMCDGKLIKACLEYRQLVCTHRKTRIVCLSVSVHNWVSVQQGASGGTNGPKCPFSSPGCSTGVFVCTDRLCWVLFQFTGHHPAICCFTNQPNGTINPVDTSVTTHCSSLSKRVNK